MAGPLQSASIAAPGFFGLNTQESGITLDSGFALQATNCVIDKFGRLGSRKGWTFLDESTGINLKGMHRFVDLDAVEYFGAWTSNSFYIYSSGTLSSVTYTGGQTITSGNWQAVTLNDAAYLFQSGYEPIYFKPTTGQLDDVTNATNSATVTIANTSTVTVANTNSVTITHSGTVATVTQSSHFLSTGDEVVISGANETEYNGTFTITVLDGDTYKYTMSSSPSQDATGTTESNTKIATVTHTNHAFEDLTSVRISGANETGYNGTFTIHVLGTDSYYYNMESIPTTDATGTISASVDKATVTHSGHPLATGDEVVISGATPSDFNGTFEITVVDVNTYYYTLPSILTSNPTGTITATWDKGTPPSANTVVSAYGRLWAASTANNKTTLYWSDLLDGTDWKSGTAGSLDISGILVYGNDEIIGLGAHNGFLIIFCKQNVIIFGDSDNNQQYLDPTTLQLIEVISGVGCIARDSIQNTGTDILFLSESGLMSLGRVIQEKSTPMRDLSKNVRDDLVQLIESETPSNIKSTYSESNAFYLLSFPTTKQVYCFDMRAPLQDGSARVTIWNNMEFTDWLAFDGEVYMTHADGLARYFGYQDNSQAYRMVYFTNYFDLNNATQIKLLKRLAMTVIGATGQDFVVKSGFDYSDQYTSYPLTVRQGTIGEYNIAEYNIAEYSGGTLVDTVRIPGSGSGSVLQLGFEADVNGGALSIQKMDVYVKQGRTI